MPNLTGGKHYKKSKHAGSIEKPFVEKEPDQLYGRILRNLGGRNMLVYCNDNKTRLCHICGGMKKSNWLNVGDLALISLRDFEKKPEAGAKDKYEKGDIIHKYDQDHLGKLKKLPDINPKLFMQLETMDGTVLAAIGEKEEKLKKQGKVLQQQDDDCGIEFDRGDDEDEEEESGSEDDKARAGKANKPVKTSKLASATAKDREDAEDEVNIDDI
jgi:translation initiation factor 1A